MKALKVFLILLATVAMGAVIMFIDESTVIDSIAGAFFVSINVFLGIDLFTMIKESRALPRTEYKDIHLYRYILTLVIMGILFVLCVYRKNTDGITALVAMSSFGGGFILIIGMIVGGLQGNKLAQGAGPEKIE